VENLAVSGKTALPQLAGKQREFQLDIDMKDARFITLNLMETDDERFTISYDRQTEILRVDRSHCGYPLTADLSPEKKPWCEAKVPLKNGKLNLHIFVDVSIVEIYADEGRTAMSSLAFPKGGAYGVSVEADGAVGVCARSWTLEKA